jgi:hypothetical protein
MLAWRVQPLTVDLHQSHHCGCAVRMRQRHACPAAAGLSDALACTDVPASCCCGCVSLFAAVLCRGSVIMSCGCWPERLQLYRWLLWRNGHVMVASSSLIRGCAAPVRLVMRHPAAGIAASVHHHLVQGQPASVTVSSLLTACVAMHVVARITWCPCAACPVAACAGAVPAARPVSAQCSISDLGLITMVSSATPQPCIQKFAGS